MRFRRTAATAAAVLTFALKGKYTNSDQQSPIVARPLLRWTVALQCFAVWINGQFQCKVLLFSGRWNCRLLL